MLHSVVTIKNGIFQTASANMVGRPPAACRTAPAQGRRPRHLPRHLLSPGYLRGPPEAGVGILARRVAPSLSFLLVFHRRFLERAEADTHFVEPTPHMGGL
jgi:hypothetical protein